MEALINFHDCAVELLRHLGFDAPVLAADQEVVNLLVEERFSLHFGSIDEDSWFMLADLGDALPSPGPTLLEHALRRNQLTDQP